VKSRALSVSIAASPGAVYEFAANPLNLPKWAKGLCTSIEKVGNTWIGQGAMGKVKIEMVEPNHLGILDHMVTLPSGQRVMVPIRVHAKGKGSEVVFTLNPTPGMTEVQIAADANLVLKDLEALKQAVEGLAKAGPST
jgi:uncharacterized protein YndB with AHSA1/START domain